MQIVVLTTQWTVNDVPGKEPELVLTASEGSFQGSFPRKLLTIRTGNTLELFPWDGHYWRATVYSRVPNKGAANLI